MNSHSIAFYGTFILFTGESLKRINAEVSSHSSYQSLSFLTELESELSQSIFNVILTMNDLLSPSTDASKPKKKKMKFSDSGKNTDSMSERKNCYSNLIQATQHNNSLASYLVKWLLGQGYDKTLFSYSLEFCDDHFFREMARCVFDAWRFTEKLSSRAFEVFDAVLSVLAKKGFDSALDETRLQLVVRYLKAFREEKRLERCRREQAGNVSFISLQFPSSLFTMTDSVASYLELANSILLEPPLCYFNFVHYFQNMRRLDLSGKNNEFMEVESLKDHFVPNRFEDCFTVHSIVCWWNYAYSVTASFEEADRLFRDLLALVAFEREVKRMDSGKQIPIDRMSEEVVGFGTNVIASILSHLDTLLYDVESFPSTAVSSTGRIIGKTSFQEAFQDLPMLLRSLIRALTHLLASDSKLVAILSCLDWKLKYRLDTRNESQNVGNYHVPDCFLLLVDRLMFGVLLRESEFPLAPADPNSVSTRPRRNQSINQPQQVEEERREREFAREFEWPRREMFESLTLAVQLVTQHLLSYTQAQMLERDFDLHSLVKWIYHQYFEILFYMEELFAKNYSNV
jgi:hypothetical protein